MAPVLKTWYTLSTVSASRERVVARFLSDEFRCELESALVVTVERPLAHLAASQQIERFREEFLVGVGVDTGVVELWAEEDDEPTRVVGIEAHYSFSAYSPEEWRALASSIEQRLNAERAENAAHRAKWRELESFISQLLHRAEAKRSLTAKSTAAADGQVDALERVLNKLTGT